MCNSKRQLPWPYRSPEDLDIETDLASGMKLIQTFKNDDRRSAFIHETVRWVEPEGFVTGDYCVEIVRSAEDYDILWFKECEAAVNALLNQGFHRV